MQMALDAARGCGIWVFQTPKDMSNPEHARMFVSQVAELAALRFGVGVK